MAVGLEASLAPLSLLLVVLRPGLAKRLRPQVVLYLHLCEESVRRAGPEGRVAAEPTPEPVAEPELAVALATPAQVEAAEAAPAKKAVAAVARKPAARKPRPVAH